MAKIKYVVETKLTVERKALRIACRWLEFGGHQYSACYECNKDCSKDGVCAKCFERHCLKLARAQEAGAGG